MGSHAKVSSLFYNLGRMVGPKVRKAKWLWQSITAGEADAIEAEHKVGRDLANEIGNRLELDADRPAHRTVSEVASRLTARVANKRRKFSFTVLRAAEPNAFALPGGFVFVNRSLLDLCQWNRDEIAFILAHEMAHVIRGHAMDRILTDAAIAVGAKTTAVRHLMASWLGRVGVRYLQSAYSQDRELQADSLAAHLVAAAGYDPRAARKLLARLSELSRSENHKSIGPYFSSHPPFDVRIRNLDRLARRLN